jgi:hypothetical protein
VTLGASKPSSVVPSQRTGDVVYATDDFLVATWKNISIVVWGTRATPALVTEMDRALEPFDAMRSSGFSSIHFITKDAPPPAGEARDMLRRLGARHAKTLVCVCHVVEASGFWASALHSVILGLNLIARRPYELQIASSIQEVARWLPDRHTRRTGVAISETELENVLTSLRQRIP